MSKTETRRFEWKRHRIAGSSWQTDFAKQRTEPGYADYERFTNERTIGYGKTARYLVASLDTAEVEARMIVLEDRIVTGVGMDAEVVEREVTIGERFLVIDGMGRIVIPEGHGHYKFTTEADAKKALAKWRKQSAKWWAERAQLKAAKAAVEALPRTTAPAGIFPATTETKVGDVVLVQGHGYLRAGLVIEETATRVKVAYTTRTRVNEGGLPSAKWVNKTARIAA